METLSIILILIMGASVAYPIITDKWGTVSLVVGNLVVYFSLMAVQLMGKDGLFYGTVMDLIFFPSDLHSYRIYTTVTSAFLHIGPMHIFMNLVFLFLLGFPLEIKQGSRRTVALYIPSAVGGSILYALLSQGNVPALGASGAIAGFLGALVALYPRDEIPMFLGPIFLRRLPVFIVAGVFLIMEGAYAFSVSDNVAHTAHIGGLIAGMAVGALSSKIAFRKKEPAKVSVDGLKDLAHTEEAVEILERLENEDNPEIREAWLHEFADTVACPKCNGVLEIKADRISCPRCGWERKIE
jgi:membrane associated rhomboid family serine protease